MTRAVDLRSDTVTQPTEAMCRAMATAEVGDDYYGEDPTVKRLEALASEMLGKEAGLFLTSGTMGNLVSIMTHTHRGDAVILEADSHTYHNEHGGLSAVAGVLPRPVKGHLGVMAPKDVEAVITGRDVLHSPTSLICVENTHNMAGGTCWTVRDLESIREVADRYGLLIHVDGARIFNAAVALKVPPAALAKDADSVTFCLTKGLACPFGSVVCGSGEFIEETRRNRQMIGGGMRQAGIMAAAGIIGLETMVDRLAEDHENARILANGLVKLGLEVNLEAVQTNIVFFKLPPFSRISSREFVEHLRKENVLLNPPHGDRIRLVTHFGVTREDVDKVLEVMRKVLS